MIKAIHVHTNLMFISGTKKFFGNYFENQIVIIGNSNHYNGSDKNNALFFDSTPKSVRKIIELCISADLVVLYDLDFIKCEIALGLPERTTIAWRFFGHELYGQSDASTLTQQSLLLNKTQLISKFRQKIIRSIQVRWKWRFLLKSPFAEAVNRIKFFLCFSQDEYDHLLTKWPNLPIFVRLPINSSYATFADYQVKKEYIIIGNNRGYYNNNLDIINIIDASEKHNQFQFVLLFNYGPESNYSHKVRNEVKGKKYYKVINDFMPLDKFEELYQNASAVILNGYRQMALANIFTALCYGVKLYLNKKNTLMQWFKNEGLLIYSIDDFVQDLEMGNISLSIEEAKYNVELLQKMIKSYTTDDFQKALYSLIKGNTPGSSKNHSNRWLSHQFHLRF